MVNRMWISLLLILYLTGCNSLNAASKDPPRSGTPDQVAENQSPYPPTQIPSTASLPSTEFSVTSTVTLSPSQTAAATPTFTPRPTLTVDRAKTLILNLVQNPTDCQLPCLWGFIPGQSELSAVKDFVKQFGLGDFFYGDIEIGAHIFKNSGGVGISYLKDETIIAIDWSYYPDMETSRIKFLSLSAFPLIKGGPVPAGMAPAVALVWGDETFDEELQKYLLPSILSTYGIPEQVYITTQSDEPDRQDIKGYLFSVALIYPEQGIYVEYASPREMDGNVYLGCPHKSHIYLAVWDPQLDLSLDYIIERVSSKMRPGYSQPLTEATSLSIDEFFETFKNPRNPVCLETPKDLWIYP